MNYARRQQYRRLSHAGRAAVGSVVVGLLGLTVAIAGAAALGGLLFSRPSGWFLRAPVALARSSESGRGALRGAVQRALAPLQAEGWRLRHSLPWQGRGDLDSVAVSPTGIAVVIETKTRSYDHRHLARVREQVAWLSRRRRRWTRNGALAAMCLARARGVERAEDDVLVVSIERLTDILRVVAGTGRDPPSSS